jgi:hypothetical protein
MTRPPLTQALSSVLAAAVDGPDRPGLLATLRPDVPRSDIEHPDVERTDVQRTDGERSDGERSDVQRTGHAPEPAASATVITMPRVIPMPRRAAPTQEPDPAA